MMISNLIVFTSLVFGFCFTIDNSYCGQINAQQITNRNQESIQNNEQQSKSSKKSNGIVLHYSNNQICHYRVPEYAPGYVAQKPVVPSYVTRYNQQQKKTRK